MNNQSKPHVSFKEPEIDELKQQDENTYQRLSRASVTNKSIENSSRSSSEPRRETIPTQSSTS